MAKYFLTVKAKEDLKNIWKYTYNNWGEKQAYQYIDNLKRQFEELLKFPEKGKSRDEVIEGYRSICSQSHIIFYRYKEKRIEVVRIIHKSMDIENHFE